MLLKNLLKTKNIFNNTYTFYLLKTIFPLGIFPASN